MELDRAREINKKIFAVAIAAHLEGRTESLPADISLEEMLVATRLVGESRDQVNEQGKKITTMTVDPRMIALLYAFEHWGNSPVEMIGALGFTFDEDLIEFCAGC